MTEVFDQYQRRRWMASPRGSCIAIVMGLCDMKGKCVAYLIYKDAKTRTAVKEWPINIMTWPLAAHESGSDESPS